MGNHQKKLKKKAIKNKDTKQIQSKKPQLVDKSQVKYNVFLTAKNEKSNNTFSKKTLVKPQKTNNKQNTFLKIIKNLFFIFKTNIHIIFNSIILFIFLIFSYGLIKTNIVSNTINIYIIAIMLFFMIIAISYNKYISGKVFTTILSIIMLTSVIYMNNVYGYINRLNNSYYEDKTYYIITFDNNTNQSIYSINNKNIGLIKNQNTANLKKVLDLKIDGANYQTYDNLNNLYNDFFSSKTRAIILNENQYMYLVNNIDKHNHTIKILDSFTTTSKI